MRPSYHHALCILAAALLLHCSDASQDGRTGDGSADTDRARDASRDTRPTDQDVHADPAADAPVPDGQASGEDTDNDAEAPPVPDTANLGDTAEEGWCGDVDILFVIDDSGSMADNQASLIRSFPRFVEGMQTQLARALSFRVGVTTSSDLFGNRTGCTQIGNLVTRTTGPASSSRQCGPFASGAAWIGHDDPDLEAHFACVAQVGVGGSDDERLMRGALNAIRPEVTGPGACNEGFARPDALLVLVLITDEDDVPDGCDGLGNCMSQGSGGVPDDWVAELASHRGGTTDDVVVLALVGVRPDNPCGAVVNARVRGFARRIGGASLVGDVCADSYDAFFADALPLINETCGKR